VEHEFDVEDPRLAQIAKQCQDLPGQELFQYLDENGKVCDIGSSDVNDYLREISGEDFTAKDFRTWAGTVLAAAALKELEKFDSRAQAKKNIVRAVEVVASKLGNTKAVCRKCYIHPEILNAYMDGQLIENLAKKAERMQRSAGTKLRSEEAAVLALLKKRLKVVRSGKSAEARRAADAPKTVREALQRSLKLVASDPSSHRRRKAS
jgi:DNA topoisomerase-1